MYGNEMAIAPTWPMVKRLAVLCFAAIIAHEVPASSSGILAEDFAGMSVDSGDNGGAWNESFGIGLPDPAYQYDNAFDSHVTPNNWMAEQSMFVSQTGTNQFGQDGMALKLSGGLGAVTMNHADANLPDGLDSVSFDARIGQTLHFDDFAYSKNHLSDTNYAVSGECIFSPLYNGMNMSPASPSVSAAIFYSPGGGCYEYRARLIQRQTAPFTANSGARMEYTLYKWYRDGSVMTNVVLTRRCGILNSNYPYHHNNYSGDNVTQQRNRFTYWSGIFISAHYDKDTKKTYVCAGIANQKNSYGISYNYSKYFYGSGNPPQATGNNGYLTVTDDGTIGGTPHSRGTFGFAFNDCPGYVGFINQHALDSNHRIDAAKDINGVAIPTSTAVATLLNQREVYNELHFDTPEETAWAFPPGRMTVMRDADKLFTVSETYKWGYGVKAVIPTNSVDVYVKESGGEWAKAGEANVSSFQTNRVEFVVRSTAPSRVKLAAADGSGDVVVDNIEVSEWMAGDSNGLESDAYGLKDEWVYTQGRLVETATESGIGCRLQPRRGAAAKPMGIRSPFVEGKVARFSFGYTNADSNAILLVQVATNVALLGFYDPATLDPPDGGIWTTIQTNTFESSPSGICACDLPDGTPLHGAVRLVVAPQTMENSTSMPIDYGAITITGISLDLVADDGHTTTTPVSVPHEWLAGYGLGVASGDFEAAAKAPSGKRAPDGKAMSVWEDFVAGTDPTNANSVFTATIEMVDGAPRVRWSPDLNSNGVVRTYTVFGKAELSDESWHSPTNAADRFFKVEVGMP